ncbi:hypothetical protein MLD38_038472 [Melastoma candidum]|uniref:Uncharacterized protein n=1 Tax=Melastoma candidum TaxID=119954 RepID=A0ACB9KZL5_9MYRT|nr:hypothetical protein MLD38_038472 [Melastoma candidum]
MALFRSLSALFRRNVQQQKSSPLTLFRWIQMQTSSQDTDLRSQLKELIPEQQASPLPLPCCESVLICAMSSHFLNWIVYLVHSLSLTCSEQLKKLKAEHGKVQLGNITLDMVLGGMRGMIGLLWETSLLDPEEAKIGCHWLLREFVFGVFQFQKCQKLLPAAILWLLLTGKFVRDIWSFRSLARGKLMHYQMSYKPSTVPHLILFRYVLADYVYKAIDALPETAHPMTQFASGVMALQEEFFVASFTSNFLKIEVHELFLRFKVNSNKHMRRYWEPTYEDSLNLIARLPLVASFVYRRIFKGGQSIPVDDYLDYGGNFSRMLGFDNPVMHELMRLYVTIHSDHEGGNVSAHTGHLVASALSDPYLSFAVALNGLAGPLHGLANQEFLLWIKSVVDECGENITKTLNSGKVPCRLHLPDDPLFQLVSKLYEVVPPVLTELGKVKNPWPNVDAHSGVLLNHFGLTEARYYTVLFGVSRSIGICSQLIWDRALGLPLERPKSVTMDWLEHHCKKAASS